MIAYDDSSNPSSFALTCIFSGERTALTTKYPFLINAFAVYSPSPEDEPVTIATGLFPAFAGVTFCCDDAARATTARPPRRVGVAARLPDDDPFLAVVSASRRVRRRRRAERRRARVHDWLAGWCARRREVATESTCAARAIPGARSRREVGVWIILTHLDRDCSSILARTRFTRESRKVQ